jgi:hypothetical protein
MSGLDFWLGEWDAVWDGGLGRNSVTLELHGRAVVERFRTVEADPFLGMSVSVPGNHADEWLQTWADSQGSYWNFRGGPSDDGTFVFGTDQPVDAEAVFKRMVFFDISPDSFRWRWEFSRDATNWEPKWLITYTRRANSA